MKGTGDLTIGWQLRVEIESRAEDDAQGRLIAVQRCRHVEWLVGVFSRSRTLLPNPRQPANEQEERSCSDDLQTRAVAFSEID